MSSGSSAGESRADSNEPLLAFERQCEAFHEIFEAVHNAWLADPPRLVPREFSVVDPSELSATARALIQSTIGERQFGIAEGVDTSIAAMLSSAIPNAAAGASAAGGRGALKSTVVRSSFKLSFK